MKHTLHQFSKMLDGLLLFECLYLAASMRILFIFKYRYAPQVILLCITVSFSLSEGFSCIFWYSLNGVMLEVNVQSSLSVDS